MNHIILIRHGMTAGNAERRYVGATDEPLCSAGITEVNELSHILSKSFIMDNNIIKTDNDMDTFENEHRIRIEYIWTSPMLRAIQTAKLLFGNSRIAIDPMMTETDFGIFEGKTAEELSSCEEYSRWLDSMCMSPIPMGDDINEFKSRTCNAFKNHLSELKDGESAAFVIHGGSIMAIMERFCEPSRNYYEYHIPTASYILCSWNGDNLHMLGGALC